MLTDEQTQAKLTEMYQTLDTIAEQEAHDREQLAIRAIQRSILKLSSRIRLNAVAEQEARFKVAASLAEHDADKQASQPVRIIKGRLQGCGFEKLGSK